LRQVPKLVARLFLHLRTLDITEEVNWREGDLEALAKVLPSLPRVQTLEMWKMLNFHLSSDCLASPRPPPTRLGASADCLGPSSPPCSITLSLRTTTFHPLFCHASLLSHQTQLVACKPSLNLVSFLRHSVLFSARWYLPLPALYPSSSPIAMWNPLAVCLNCKTKSLPGCLIILNGPKKAKVLKGFSRTVTSRDLTLNSSGSAKMLSLLKIFCLTPLMSSLMKSY